jgi:glucosamine 6-phosphate synthetase-like amidotransferase/phosphosugar isomerase protein
VQLGLGFDAAEIDRVVITACGTAYYSGWSANT